MRKKKSIINIFIGLSTYLISFFPVFIVRKVFLDTLGSELLGLNSLFSSIIGYLTIAEMGIGSAIIFSLYKPYAESNFKKVKGYLSFYKKFFLIVGTIILIGGILISFFLELFINESIDIYKAKCYFILYLINTLLSYMFSYKHCLINVSQEGYKISIYSTFSKFIISVLQVIVLKFYSSFSFYLIVQIIVNLIYYIWVDNYINKNYANIINEKGVINKSEKKELGIKIRALFYHNIGSIFVFGTDNIVISTFVSLTSVTKVNNYNLVISSLSNMINSSFKLITPSIGNLLVEDNKENAYIIHKHLFFSRFWIASFIFISLFNTLDQFIVIWVGSNQLLDNVTMIVLLINMYLLFINGEIDQFKSAAGEYDKDKYAPIVEGVINLITSIILVKLVGVSGVFLGTMISTVLVIFWIKPFIVYKYVFKKPLINYFKMYFYYTLISFIPLFLTNILVHELKNSYCLASFIINCIINILVINCFYIVVFWKNKSFIYFKNTILKIFIKK
ncbi:O-unit flippase [Clostridium perfringens]